MANAPISAEDLAGILLDSHTDWYLERLTGKGQADEIGAAVDRTLHTLRGVKLRDVIKAADVRAVARKYACDVSIGGIIPQLVGEVANDIYHHKVHAETTLEDLIPDRRFRELTDKLLELRKLRESFAKHSVSNPIFARLVAELLSTGIRDYMKKGSDLSAKVPGAKSAFKLGRKVMERARPDIGEVLDDNLRAFVQKQTDASLRASEQFLMDALASDEFREVVTEVWEANKHRSLSSIRDYAGHIDVEEFFVIGYEHWQELRQQKFVAALIDAGVNAVFKHIGTRKIGDILEDIGISDEMIREDALRFAPPVIAGLHKKELLRPLIRESLAEYYASDALRDVLKKHSVG